MPEWLNADTIKSAGGIVVGLVALGLLVLKERNDAKKDARIEARFCQLTESTNEVVKKNTEAWERNNDTMLRYNSLMDKVLDVLVHRTR